MLNIKEAAALYTDNILSESEKEKLYSLLMTGIKDGKTKIEYTPPINTNISKVLDYLKSLGYTVGRDNTTIIITGWDYYRE